MSSFWCLVAFFASFLLFGTNSQCHLSEDASPCSGFSIQYLGDCSSYYELRDLNDDSIVSSRYNVWGTICDESANVRPNTCYKLIVHEGSSVNDYCDDIWAWYWGWAVYPDGCTYSANTWTDPNYCVGNGPTYTPTNQPTGN